MDLNSYLPYLLAGAGVILQWFRADKRFTDEWYTIAAVGLALICTMLVATWVGPWQRFVLELLVQTGKNVLVLIGSTQATSTLANIAAGRGFNPQSAAVPVTNSK
jgi:hypothetical protein